jgi:hypothetical protein
LQKYFIFVKSDRRVNSIDQKSFLNNIFRQFSKEFSFTTTRLVWEFELKNAFGWIGPFDFHKFSQTKRLRRRRSSVHLYDTFTMRIVRESRTQRETTLKPRVNDIASAERHLGGERIVYEISLSNCVDKPLKKQLFFNLFFFYRFTMRDIHKSDILIRFFIVPPGNGADSIWILNLTTSSRRTVK